MLSAALFAAIGLSLVGELERRGNEVELELDRP
jgi:hypothetical protein